MLAGSMVSPHQRSPGRADEARFSLPHLLLYSVLLALYFFLVLRYLSGWLGELFHHHRVGYATAAIGLMIVQAVGLESVSAFILRRVLRRKG